MTTTLDEGDLLLLVTGFVPPAEFHPYVIRIALELGLRGWIRHEAAGALLRAVGAEEQLVQLVRAIRDHPTSSSRIRALEPELITAHTPGVGERFIALGEEPGPFVEPAPAAELEHVA